MYRFNFNFIFNDWKTNIFRQFRLCESWRERTLKLFWPSFQLWGRRHEIQHNDIQDNGTMYPWLIFETQHKQHSAQMTLSITAQAPLCFLSLYWMSHFILCYAECHSLCFLSLCWISLCFMSLCWVSRCHKLGCFVDKHVLNSVDE